MKLKIISRVNIPIVVIVWHLSSARVVLYDSSKYDGPDGYGYGFPMIWHFQLLTSLSCKIYAAPMLINIMFLALATYIVIKLLRIANINKYMHNFIYDNYSENVKEFITWYQKFVWLLAILCILYLCLSLLMYHAADGVRFYWWYNFDL